MADQSRAKHSHKVSELQQKLTLAEQDMIPLREDAKAKACFEARAAKVEPLEEERKELKRLLQFREQEMSALDEKYDALAGDLTQTQQRVHKLTNRCAALTTELDAAERCRVEETRGHFTLASEPASPLWCPGTGKA